MSLLPVSGDRPPVLRSAVDPRRVAAEAFRPGRAVKGGRVPDSIGLPGRSAFLD